jgi:cell division protein FtsQ
MAKTDKRMAKREARETDSESASGLWTRRMRLAVLAIIVMIAAGSPFWGPLILRRMAFFHVHRIEILGARYVAPSDILGRLHVDTMASVWDPTAPLAARVAMHPEVAHADVHRKLPGTLVVRVTERVPVALVPATGGFRVYDERGMALPIDPSKVTVDVPVLTQRDTAALRLLGEMRVGMPVLYARVSSVSPVGKDELLLELKSQPVRAMKDVTLERLADIEPVEADLGRKQLHATEIDLRYRDQVIARLQ